METEKKGIYYEEAKKLLEWMKSFDWSPIAPSIDGPTKGSLGEEYEYIISSRDPDGDDYV